MTTITQKRYSMLATLNNCLAIFAFESQSCFVFGNDTQRHVNKGAQQMAEHRLSYLQAKADKAFPGIQRLYGILSSKKISFLGPTYISLCKTIYGKG